jgi:hypothetical protein
MRRHGWSSAVVVLTFASLAWAETRSFGKPLAGLEATRLDAVLAKPEAGKLIRLEGTIAAVCRNKGCWLELAQDARSIHVTFQGYSFFVPKDSAGKAAAVEGHLRVKDPEPGQVAHLESEGARAAAARVSIEAVGVEIRDDAK